MNHRPAHVHDPMQMASAVHAYAQFQQFQQPYFYLMGYPTTSAFADRRQAHPHLQSPQVQVAYQHNLFQGQKPVDGVPTPHEPALQASGWLQPFNESELKVAGILPYSYGMPRYGQQPFRPEGGDMTNKLNPYGRGFPYGFYKTVL